MSWAAGFGLAAALALGGCADDGGGGGDTPPPPPPPPSNSAPRITRAKATILFLWDQTFDSPGLTVGPLWVTAGNWLCCGVEYTDSDGDACTVTWSIVGHDPAVDGSLSYSGALWDDSVWYESPPSAPSSNYYVAVRGEVSDGRGGFDVVIFDVYLND